MLYGAARIIKQYVSYCKEMAFNHLSERELYRVLKYCPAQQKKALQGLDNISTDWLCEVEKLENIIRKLGERGKSSERVTGVINLLMAFKSYLKDSYRLHVSTSSRCPDHCSTFALSDPSEPEFVWSLPWFGVQWMWKSLPSRKLDEECFLRPWSCFLEQWRKGR